MSKMGELQDQLEREKRDRYPDKPVQITVGRTSTWGSLMSEPGISQLLEAVPNGLKFAGVPIGAAGGTDRDYDFKIAFEGDEK